MKEPVTAETKTRTPSMKWVKLGEGKDPEFDTPLFLRYKEGGFDFGFLKKIETSGGGKEYTFSCGESDELSGFTHYCVPVSPKN